LKSLGTIIEKAKAVGFEKDPQPISKTLEEGAVVCQPSILPDFTESFAKSLQGWQEWSCNINGFFKRFYDILLLTGI
jgi:hypothetical protein